MTLNFSFPIFKVGIVLVHVLKIYFYFFERQSDRDRESQGDWWQGWDGGRDLSSSGPSVTTITGTGLKLGSRSSICVSHVGAWTYFHRCIKRKLVRKLEEQGLNLAFFCDAGLTCCATGPSQS